MSASGYFSGKETGEGLRPQHFPHLTQRPAEGDGREAHTRLTSLSSSSLFIPRVSREADSCPTLQKRKQVQRQRATCPRSFMIHDGGWSSGPFECGPSLGWEDSPHCRDEMRILSNTSDRNPSQTCLSKKKETYSSLIQSG